jgi:hypothetical protein
VVDALGFEDVDPGLVGRCAWETDQTRRDLEVLAWVGRFRFVEPRAIAERFGVSWQQANARVRRLERLGLVGTERRHMFQSRAVFLTGRGCELLGRPRRRPPRAQVQREHEAAIVWLVTRLEREHEPARVLTERECRRLEADGEQRYSLRLQGRGDRQRWPDVVVEHPDRYEAFEIEFAPKGTARLRRIIEAYQLGSPYTRTTIYVTNAALGLRIARLARRTPYVSARLSLRSDEVVVEPWPALAPERYAHLAAALEPTAPSQPAR